MSPPPHVRRFDAARRECDIARWSAARQAGFDVEIVDDAELALVTSPDLPGPAFNRVHGLSTRPDLLPRVLDLFRAADRPGWLQMDERPWPGAVPATTIELHLAPPTTILARAAAGAHPAGLDVREVGTADDLDAWTELMVGGSDLGGAPPHAWRRIIPPLADQAGHHLVLARLHGRAVGVGLVGIRRGVAYLRSTNVVPEARGRGIQRALIAVRARIAAEAGADLVGAGTSPDGAASVRNLVRLGFEQVWSRPAYRFDPAGDPLAGQPPPRRADRGPGRRGA